MNPRPRGAAARRGDSGFGAGFEVCSEVSAAPRLVGIDDQFRRRGGGAHRCEPLIVAVAGELHLEERAITGALGCTRHGFRRSDRKGESRRHRRETIETGQAKGRNTEAFRLEIPQGTIDGVARRPGRQEALQM